MARLANQRMARRTSKPLESNSAHLLLLGWCVILDGQLEELFRTWHPRVRTMTCRANVEL